MTVLPIGTEWKSREKGKTDVNKFCRFAIIIFELQATVLLSISVLCLSDAQQLEIIQGKQSTFRAPDLERLYRVKVQLHHAQEMT